MRKVFDAINKNWQTAKFATQAEKKWKQERNINLSYEVVEGRKTGKYWSAIELHHGKTFWLVYHFIILMIAVGCWIWSYSCCCVVFILGKRKLQSEIHYITFVDLVIKKNEKVFFSRTISTTIVKMASTNFVMFKLLSETLCFELQQSIKCTIYGGRPRKVNFFNIQVITLSLIHRWLTASLSVCSFWFLSETFMLSS